MTEALERKQKDQAEIDAMEQKKSSLMMEIEICKKARML